MDEPFGALDAQTRAQMQAYLLQIWKQVDITILFITHDLDEAIYLADRIVVLGRAPGPRARGDRGAGAAAAHADAVPVADLRRRASAHLEELIHPRPAERADRVAADGPHDATSGDDVE